MRAPSALASSSAPCLTACQNWCWKPLETIAMYGCSPPPPPPLAAVEPPPLSESEPHAATTSASPAAIDRRAACYPIMCLSPSVHTVRLRAMSA